MINKYIVIVLIIFLSAQLSAQIGYGSRSTKKAMTELSRSLDENKTDTIVAKDYIKLAESFAAKKDYVKAEENYKKARTFYVKLNDKTNIAKIDRELAKLQEAQNKLPEAIANYELAGKLSTSSSMSSMNKNDANRLYFSKEPEKQTKYISGNVALSSQMKDSEEQTFAFRNMAQNNMQMKDTDAALDNLKRAKTVAGDNPVVEVELNQQIADVYMQTNQTEKAVEITKEAVIVAKEIKDPTVKVEQLQALSSIYADAQDTEAAIDVLSEAYDVAVRDNNVRDAKNTLQLLANKYIKDRQSQKALDLYSDFTDRLDMLIKNDSTLTDSKFFEVQEKRITQLEKERALKDELIEKQNLINYVLIVVIVLILVFIVFIIRSLYSITRKNKKIALQSLRREMNPHFIFNSLNSVNQFIAQNDELEANKYLTSYSRLMRNTMENSNKDFVPLSVELEHLKQYLDLEALRFHDKFSYSISIDDDVDTEFVLVPNMLIQPQLENAIWHGLRYKDEKGFLRLSISHDRNNIIIKIEDNGIGLKKSSELKTTHQKAHNSRGLKNTYERINLLNSLYKTKIKISITDKEGDESGVIVLIECPLNIKR